MTEESTRPDEEPSVVEVLVRDPLNQVTRKERVYLLAVSLIGIAIVKTGLVPSKIATFGIELDQPDRQTLLVLLAIMTAYFLIGFLVYAASDYVTRREVIRLIKARLADSRDMEDQQAQSPTQGHADEAQPPSERHTGEVLPPASRDTQQRTVKETMTPAVSLVDVLRRLGEVTARATIPFATAAEQLGKTMVLIVGVPTTRELLRNDELEQLGASRGSRIVAGLRIFFEFVLPILVGIYAIYTLLTASS